MLFVVVSSLSLTPVHWCMCNSRIKHLLLFIMHRERARLCASIEHRFYDEILYIHQRSNTHLNLASINVKNDAVLFGVLFEKKEFFLLLHFRSVSFEYLLLLYLYFEVLNIMNVSFIFFCCIQENYFLGLCWF